MWLLVLLVLIVVAAAVAFFTRLAKQGQADYAKQNELVPGQAPVVPPSFGGSHDPAARLHRRLVAAMDALRANQAFDDDGSLLDLRVELQQQATALDERLAAVAALPAAQQAEPLAQAEAVVARIEEAVADLATRGLADALPDLERALGQLQAEASSLDEVQAALDAAPPAVAPAPTPEPAVEPATEPTPEAGGGTVQPG